MRPFSGFLRKINIPCILAIGATILVSAAVPRSRAAANQAGNAQDGASTAQASAPKFDISIFQNPIPSGQLSFLNDLAGSTSGEAIRDKQYHKLLQRVIPDCVFHYGYDMSLFNALDTVLKGSFVKVQIRDGRYVMVSGHNGPYLLGKGFMWIDMQDGIALGGFFFRPTNGEPTPAVNIFSEQVKEAALEMSQLPPAFAEDLSRWSADNHIPPVTTRYFVTGANKKIVLEHDEDYCAPTGGTIAPSKDVCEQMNADAADIDETAADFLDQTNHATNSTAWMINDPDQVAWIQVRDSTCNFGPDPLHCHIVMTRERTHVIINRHPFPHPTHR
jgi:hypothetical protein